MVSDRRMTFQKYLATGPADALTVTYEEENNRVRFDFAATPELRYASVKRRDSAGFLHPLPRLRMLHLDGPTVAYDYTAPLNQPSRYQVDFIRWDDDAHQIEYIREATVIPTVGDYFSGHLIQGRL